MINVLKKSADRINKGRKLTVTLFIMAGFLIVYMAVFCSREKDNLIILHNDQIEVGILSEVGGRVVLLRKPGLQNVFKSDERLWRNPKKNKPEISAFSDYKAYNGHIVWIGPQSEWWANQSLNEQRHASKADWPPDPYLIYGRYKIIEQNHSRIKMRSPASPISGIRLFKEISLESDGRVIFTATAENIRKDTICWDLWMNTRLDGFAKAYVPVEDAGIKEFIHSEDEIKETTPFKIDSGYFSFSPSIPTKPKKEQVQEVHLYPSKGFIAGFTGQQMLLIRFDLLDEDRIHLEHGQVELYSFIGGAATDPLLELEVHSEYKLLAPGETMSFNEIWEILPYNGEDNATDQIQFLCENIL